MKYKKGTEKIRREPPVVEFGGEVYLVGLACGVVFILYEACRKDTHVIHVHTLCVSTYNFIHKF